MKIFIGSSTEARPAAGLVASWIGKRSRHTPLCWYEPGCFRADRDVFGELIRLSREVDGALFIFSPDDKTWQRGALQTSTRANVLFEYGLFLGALGRDSVRRLFVGAPDLASDLVGLVRTELPGPGVTGGRRGMMGRARHEIVEWAQGLFPVYLKGLGFEAAKAFQDLGKQRSFSVADILGHRATALIAANTSDEIKAVCSEKGKHGGAYYARQFQWASEKQGRTVRRIFIRQKADGEREGFSHDEVRGICAHLAHADNGVTVRWIYQDDPDLGDSYSSSLGFAVFGAGWLAHWGLEKGWSFDPASHARGREVGDLLAAKFDLLWNKAFAFDGDLRERLCPGSGSRRDAGAETP